MKLLFWSGYWLTRFVFGLFFRLKCSGREYLPRTGPFLLCSNHISWFDPPIVGSWVPRQVYFFAKAELFSVPVLGWAIRQTNAIPVKRGTIDRAGLDAAVEILRQGYGLTVFPEGTRSKDGTPLPVKPGIGLLARRYPVPLVPCYLHGANRLGDVFWGRTKLTLTYGPSIEADWIAAQPEGRAGVEAIAARVETEIRRLREVRLQQPRV